MFTECYYAGRCLLIAISNDARQQNTWWGNKLRPLNFNMRHVPSKRGLNAKRHPCPGADAFIWVPSADDSRLFFSWLRAHPSADLSQGRSSLLRQESKLRQHNALFSSALAAGTWFCVISVCLPEFLCFCVYVCVCLSPGDGQVDFEEFMTILGPKLLSSDNREGFLGNTIDNIFWQVKDKTRVCFSTSSSSLFSTILLSSTLRSALAAFQQSSLSADLVSVGTLHKAQTHLKPHSHTLLHLPFPDKNTDFFFFSSLALKQKKTKKKKRSCWELTVFLCVCLWVQVGVCCSHCCRRYYHNK